MHIGLYGGMANNMYVFAKALAAAGRPVTFIRDRTDTYPLSQPFWEDCRTAMSIRDAGQWSWERWATIEKELGWQAPLWLVDPLQNEPPGQLRRRRRWFNQKDLVWQSLNEMFDQNPLWQRAVQWLQTCDVLIVCGFEGEQLGYLSGRPYLIWPHGGDICLAAGVPSPKDVDPAIREAHVAQQSRLALAFRKSTWIGSHDPTGVGGPFCDTSPALAGKPLLHIPIPIPRRPRPHGAERKRMRERLLSELGVSVPSERILAFVPSRADFVWKGHDRLLEATSGIDRLHFIFSGWGKDIEEATARADVAGLAKQMTFLPVSLSKPLLFELFAASDFVVDQFHLGTYGTSAIEAMAGSVPVMMYINGAVFAARGWEAPPVLNCSSVTQIRAVLEGILDGRFDLEAVGGRAGDWAERVHEPERVTAIVSKLLANRPWLAGLQ